MTAARIIVDGDTVSVENLWASLMEQPKLRRHLDREDTPAPAERMGPGLQIVLTAITAGVVSEFIRSVTQWLVDSKSSLSITVEDGDRRVSVNAERIRDVEPLVREVLRRQSVDPAPSGVAERSAEDVDKRMK